jgi:hypothetical protein
VTGGIVYRGAALPELQGVYLYSDYCQPWVRSFRWVDGQATDQRDWTPLLDPDGDLLQGVSSYGDATEPTAPTVDVAAVEAVAITFLAPRLRTVNG